MIFHARCFPHLSIAEFMGSQKRMLRRTLFFIAEFYLFFSTLSVMRSRVHKLDYHNRFNCHV